MSNNQEPKLPKSVVPWWQDGKTIIKHPGKPKEPFLLSQGVSHFFNTLKDYLLLPTQQADALECSETLLDIMAWDRDIKRFANEPLALFRKRVKYALVNAKNSGDVVGFIEIFKRLGVGSVIVNERLDGRNWDIVSFKLDDEQLSVNNDLLAAIIRQYGRTCRRYEFQVTHEVSLLRTVSAIDWQQNCSVAVLED